MVSRIVWASRVLIAVLAVAAMVGLPGSALARDTFDATGTVESKNESKETIVLITDVLGQKNQPITIDMSSLSDNFIAIRKGQSVTIEIKAREHDTFKAYSIVDEGSYTNRSDLGVQERFQVQSASIKAHVGSVPEDDEALAQQHRQNNLRRNQDDDHDNKGNNND